MCMFFFLVRRNEKMQILIKFKSVKHTHLFVLQKFNSLFQLERLGLNFSTTCCMASFK